MLQERNISDSLASWVLSTCSMQVALNANAYNSNIKFPTMSVDGEQSGMTSSVCSGLSTYDFQDIGPMIKEGRDPSVSSELSGSSESHISSFWASSTEPSLWSCLDPTGSPPKVIDVSNPCKHQGPNSIPYAQLCFDPETKSLVTLMEIDLSGHGPGKSRKRIFLDHPSDIALIPDDSPEVRASPSSSSTTDSTLSTQWSTGDTDPMILLGTQEVWLEETDLDLYLLHECGDPWRSEAKGRCTDGLKKLIHAYRARIVSRSRDASWEVPKQPFLRIGYKFLDSET